MTGEDEQKDNERKDNEGGKKSEPWEAKTPRTEVSKRREAQGGRGRRGAELGVDADYRDR